MPHYSDGTEARVGDVVRGRASYLRDADGELREVVGTVLAVEVGYTCNLVLAVTEVHDGPVPPAGVSIFGGIWAQLVIEYGQADHFELVKRA